MRYLMVAYAHHGKQGDLKVRALLDARANVKKAA